MFLKLPNALEQCSRTLTHYTVLEIRIINWSAIYLKVGTIGLKRIVYFDIRIFFNFQTNSPNILLHIKVVK